MLCLVALFIKHKNAGTLYWVSVRILSVIRQRISFDVFFEMAELFWLKIN